MNFALMAVDLAIIGIFSTTPAVVIVGVIIAGAFIGVNNTLVTTAVMSIAPVERPVASATYGFVRFIGGGLAPFAAGQIVQWIDPEAHLPFLIGAVAVLAAAFVLATVRKALAAADRGEVVQPELDALDQRRRPQARHRGPRRRRRELRPSSLTQKPRQQDIFASAGQNRRSRPAGTADLVLLLCCGRATTPSEGGGPPALHTHLQSGGPPRLTSDGPNGRMMRLRARMVGEAIRKSCCSAAACAVNPFGGG